MSRHWVSLVCALALVFALGARAYAGATGSPISSDVCPTLTPTADMNDPNTTGFNNAASVKACLKLCDTAAAQCHAFAKRSASCFNAWNAQQALFGRANCAIITSTAADLKACNASVASERSTITTEIQGELVTGLADCDSWKSVCESTCAPL
jgi:hypothetical protein